MDYAALTELITRYAENEESSFTDHIPDFVQTAERRIYNSVQLLATRKNVEGAVTLGNKYLTLPVDWLSTHSIAVITPVTLDQTFLLNKDVEFIREAFPFPAVTGRPTHYAHFDKDTLLLGPTPDANYAVELHYFAYPASIVTASTTWLGDNFSDVLLYGALREAYLYMKGEQDIVGYYEQKYQEGLALLKNHAEGKNRRDSYRTVESRLPA